jgi:hypothetical protein
VPHKPTHERPIEPLAREARFGSDVTADTLRALDIAYIALSPAASFADCMTASLIAHLPR